VPPKIGVQSYPVVERDHLVWIWMGDPEKADPDLIIDFPYLRDPNWKGIPDYLHYDANYLLIVDNLSDFAHLAFVHTKTLGGSEEYAYKTRPVAVERLPRGFRVERWHMDSAPPPFHRKVIADKEAHVDRRNIGHMHIPGIFFLETLFAPAGSGAEKGNLAGAKQYRNCQFMTPETRRTTHFFWSYLNDFEGADGNISRSLRASLIEGFMEDKAIIEAQQRTIDADPDFHMLAIASDGPLTHFRRVLDKLIAEEEAERSVEPAAPKARAVEPAASALHEVG
jgi:vanillate O-demethylase monooxygenase subunit